MPYTTGVTLVETAGGASVDVQATARLWMLWSVVGSGSGTGPQQQEMESVEVTLKADWSTRVPVSFQRDATFADVSRGVGLSIQDRGAVASDRGWLFRSGSFDPSLPNEDIEIIGAEREITSADLPGLLPAMPMTVDAQTTVTALTATLGDPPAPGQPGGIDFSATGTTTKTGVSVGFRYTGRIILSPASLVAASSDAFDVGIANPAIVFLPGPSVISAVEAELLNLLRVFIMRDLRPMVQSGIERRLNAGIASSVGRSLPGGVLPSGVVLSVRGVSVNSTRISVRAALAAFGGVMSKLPQPPPGNGGGRRICPAQTLLALGYPMLGLELLREFRDTRLATTPWGRALAESYYAHADEVSALLAADANLAGRAAALADELAPVLASGASPPHQLRRGCEDILRRIAADGSPELRRSVARVLASPPWQARSLA